MNNHKSKVYKNILELKTIESIKEFYKNQPEQHAEVGIVNKNLEYHIPENFIYKTMNPILNEIIGNDHEFDTGSYKSSKKPYILHVDSRKQQDLYPDCMSFGSKTIRHNKAVLIPLVEGDNFRTITFKVWSDFNPSYEQMVQNSTDENNLVLTDFDHDKNFSLIKKLPIDIDYRHTLGDILVWDRNQWHISNNFAKFGLVKQFLIFFIV
jgi:hypothetical protein